MISFTNFIFFLTKFKQNKQKNLVPSCSTPKLNFHPIEHSQQGSDIFRLEMGSDVKL